jgi:hypothetical protein
MWPVILAAAPGTGVWLFTLYKARQERLDKGDDRRLTFEEKQEVAFQKERDRVSAELHNILDNLRKDVENYRALLKEKDKQRYDAIELAHFWHGMAWDFRGEVRHCRQIAESACHIANLPMPVWTKSLDMPPFEADGRPKQSERAS